MIITQRTKEALFARNQVNALLALYRAGRIDIVNDLDLWEANLDSCVRGMSSVEFTAFKALTEGSQND